MVVVFLHENSFCSDDSELVLSCSCVFLFCPLFAALFRSVFLQRRLRFGHCSLIFRPPKGLAASSCVAFLADDDGLFLVNIVFCKVADDRRSSVVMIALKSCRTKSYG